MSKIGKKETDSYAAINKLLNIYPNWAINYWKSNKIFFAIYEYPFNDFIKYKKYKIKSIKIEHEKNKIFFSFKEKDRFLITHFILAKIKDLELFGIESTLKIAEKEIDKNEIELFKKLNEKEIIEITTNKNEDFLIPILSYPCIEENDPSIIKIL
jgi:hypothetical protein